MHIPSDFMVACLPEMEGTLIGDKSVSVVFDNSKIKRFVPGLSWRQPVLHRAFASRWPGLMPIRRGS